MISAQFNTHRFPMTIVNRTSMPVLFIAASGVSSLLGVFIKLMGWAGYTPPPAAWHSATARGDCLAASTASEDALVGSTSN